ncbi:hypothetical protein [Methanosarcina sp.]|uniref:hypothetical protein n=1 Tax=Methanosarcina sp. TaxID=2213 RepID=UPI002ABB4FE5|nr:hypothetical protein [Methanosarcina sp.]MDY9925648.1 hypothetical protein [Methanosarcina sp.]
MVLGKIILGNSPLKYPRMDLEIFNYCWLGELIKVIKDGNASSQKNIQRDCMFADIINK